MKEKSTHLHRQERSFLPDVRVSDCVGCSLLWEFSPFYVNVGNGKQKGEKFHPVDSVDRKPDQQDHTECQQLEDHTPRCSL
jgi:hypothetical protein